MTGLPNTNINISTARIIRDNGGLLFAVTSKPYTEAAYIGVRVKRAAGQFQPLKNARFQLVRIAGTSVVRGEAR